jgi:hypothetical protein
MGSPEFGPTMAQERGQPLGVIGPDISSIFRFMRANSVSREKSPHSEPGAAQEVAESPQAQIGKTLGIGIAAA